MLQAERSNARIMNSRAGYAAFRDEGAQFGPVLFRFSEQYEGRGLDPCIDLIERRRNGCRRIVNPRMGDDGKKFVHARPWYRPCRGALREGREPLRRSVMKR